MCEGVRLPAAESVVTSAKKCFFFGPFIWISYVHGEVHHHMSVCDLYTTNKFLGNERGKTSLTLGSI